MNNTFKVFLGFFFVYGLFCSGLIDTVDADPSVKTAQSILEGSISVGALEGMPSELRRISYARKKNGLWYSKMGLSYPVLYVPGTWLSQKISPWVNVSSLRLTHFFLSFVNALIVAFLLAMVFEFFVREGHSEKEALIVSLVLGFATLLFPYSKMAFREPLQALCLTGALMCVGKTNLRDRDYFGCALFICLGALTKIAMVMALTPIAIYALLRAWRTSLKSVGMLLAPLIAGAVVWGYFTLVAYGSWIHTGYSKAVTQFTYNPWSTPFFDGVFEQLFSLQSGLIFYMPVALLVIWPVLAKKRLESFGGWEFVIAIVCFVQIILHAKWYSPTGGEALGPRYLVSIVPLLALFFVRMPFVITKRFKPFLVALVGVSALLQVVNTSVKPQQYWEIKSNTHESYLPPQWAYNGYLFVNKLRGKEELYEIENHRGNRAWVDLRTAESLQGFNLWWLHAYRAYLRPQSTQTHLDVRK